MKLKNCNKTGYKIMHFGKNDIIPEGSVFIESWSRNDGALINSTTYSFYSFLVPLHHFKIRTFQKDKIKREELIYYPVL